jgi:hypothetical protein
MKAENWVITAGIAFAVFVLIAAIAPDKLTGGGSVSRNQGSPKATQQANADTRQGNTTATGQQHTGLVGGLVPFSQANTGRFQGMVIRTESLGSANGWGQLHMWVDDGTGGSPKEISVAPDWYLMHMGCMVEANSPITGKAFNFARVRTAAQLYAKNITIGGKTCNLRNDEGFALWSNRLR